MFVRHHHTIAVTSKHAQTENKYQHALRSSSTLQHWDVAKQHRVS